MRFIKVISEHIWLRRELVLFCSLAAVLDLRVGVVNLTFDYLTSKSVPKLRLSCKFGENPASGL